MFPQNRLKIFPLNLFFHSLCILYPRKYILPIFQYLVRFLIIEIHIIYIFCLFPLPVLQLYFPSPCHEINHHNKFMLLAWFVRRINRGKCFYHHFLPGGRAVFLLSHRLASYYQSPLYLLISTVVHDQLQLILSRHFRVWHITVDGDIFISLYLERLWSMTQDWS